LFTENPKVFNIGIAPIYLRITVEENRAELATSRECEPDQWNANVEVYFAHSTIMCK